eukprot:CAMPEP_0170180606 /NCGR_PEP_ID=MMETSP0040_2-20121228/22439_1 /TAXON_ID=641309 /ORGANISM="Lotharella oceanica, Strain CCMP622" /LENGTH=35 /DNA_ID= /DNA_START= /DNA_END= /DNA_ORIENTATION=
MTYWQLARIALLVGGLRSVHTAFVSASRMQDEEMA